MGATSQVMLVHQPHQRASLRRVIKLGGSLLDFGDLVAELRRWLAQQSPARNLLLVGGGAIADVVRHADRLHGIGENAAHWLCVRAMEVNALLVAELLPEAVYRPSLADGECADRATGLAIVDPWWFLKEEEPACAAAPLPETWDVTSDSIAARLAVICDAAELVLLKSALPSGATSTAAAAAEGYVDRYFPIAAAEILSIRCVNLRARDFPEAILQSCPTEGVRNLWLRSRDPMDDGAAAKGS